LRSGQRRRSGSTTNIEYFRAGLQFQIGYGALKPERFVVKMVSRRIVRRSGFFLGFM
jgi:hypothetical protein